VRGSRVLIGLPALLALALSTGCGASGDDGAPSNPADGTVVPPPTASVSSGAPAVVPEGYSAVVIEVAQDDGTTNELCVWLAESSDQRQRGLMEVTSLGGADGMLFRFGGGHTGSFWMKSTVLPLSIAFFAGDGAFVSATDMEPCPPASETCPLYQADGPYADAIEVVQGDLPSLGIGPGSRLSVTDRSCQPSGP
jgi:uncharacterized membrane protein (UPF0127 family)